MVFYDLKPEEATQVKKTLRPYMGRWVGFEKRVCPSFPPFFLGRFCSPDEGCKATEFLMVLCVCLTLFQVVNQWFPMP